MASFGLKERAHEKEISLRFLFLAIICWILTLSWIAVIFHFSNQTAAESSNLSHIILKLINDTLNTTIQDDTLIRKAAHSSEFALLTIISYLAISSTNKISNKTSYAESPVKLMRSDNEMNIIFTLWFSITNSIFDEYHQLFVPGRDGRILDVLIDLIGIIVILIIIRLAFTIYLKTKGRTEIVYT